MKKILLVFALFLFFGDVTYANEGLIKKAEDISLLDSDWPDYLREHGNDSKAWDWPKACMIIQLKKGK